MDHSLACLLIQLTLYLLVKRWAQAHGPFISLPTNTTNP